MSTDAELLSKSLQKLSGKLLIYRNTDGTTNYIPLLAVADSSTLIIIEKMKNKGCTRFVIVDADLTYFDY